MDFLNQVTQGAAGLQNIQANQQEMQMRQDEMQRQQALANRELTRQTQLEELTPTLFKTTPAQYKETPTGMYVPQAPVAGAASPNFSQQYVEGAPMRELISPETRTVDTEVLQKMAALSKDPMANSFNPLTGAPIATEASSFAPAMFANAPMEGGMAALNSGVPASGTFDTMFGNLKDYATLDNLRGAQMVAGQFQPQPMQQAPSGTVKVGQAPTGDIYDELRKYGYTLPKRREINFSLLG